MTSRHTASSLRFDSLRFVILAALGAACGPGKGATEDETGASTGATSGGPTTTSGEPTTGGTAGATGTDGASETADPTTTQPTTAGMTTEGESSSGGAAGCGLDACADPAVLLQVDGKTPSGLVRCADGTIHREAAVACVMPQAVGSCVDGPADDCKTDADCVEHAFGTCVETFFCGFTAEACGCVYGCETDADCGDGEVCLCAAEGVSTRSRCVSAGCTVDADCGGSACAVSTDPFDSPAISTLQCHAEGDACCGDGDCELGAECRFGGSTPGAWACDFGGDCGRPLRIEGRSEVAEETGRSDWRAALANVVMPAAAVREALARHWSAIGRAEHASVASFARFILQLLAVGAPASLVAEAQQALADEVEHARVCFALASAYAGRDVGPGPLPAACGPLATDLAEVVRAVIEEACVGETLSALEVAEAAALAEDPAVGSSLLKIYGDEARHAALGWRFVAWAATQDASLRGRADGWFAAAAGAAEARADEWSGDASLRRHGVVDPGLRAALVRGGLAAVVRPCAAEVLKAA